MYSLFYLNIGLCVASFWYLVHLFTLFVLFCNSLLLNIIKSVNCLSKHRNSIRISRQQFWFRANKQALVKDDITAHRMNTLKTFETAKTIDLKTLHCLAGSNYRLIVSSRDCLRISKFTLVSPVFSTEDVAIHTHLNVMNRKVFWCDLKSIAWMNLAKKWGHKWFPSSHYTCLSRHHWLKQLWNWKIATFFCYCLPFLQMHFIPMSAVWVSRIPIVDFSLFGSG